MSPEPTEGEPLPGYPVPKHDPVPQGSLQPEIEALHGLPVLAEVRAVEAAPAVVLPAVQAAAVAATGFLAGAATLALLHRRSGRRLAHAQHPALRGRPDLLPVRGTHTYLVDVHVIAKPGE
ncbi:MAG: hypothetical protein M3Z27_10380 [Actinomycetota bacterium]|nr:hypothetical protein [Actinomycetota bacterium]